MELKNYIFTSGKEFAEFKQSIYEQQKQKYSTLDKHATETSRTQR